MVEINFIKGVKERTVPKIKVYRSNDGRSGKALFIFEKPEIFLDNSSLKIKGMFLIDKEGELFTRDISIFNSSKKEESSIEAIYSWTTINDFHRFLRFASSYAEYNGIGYPMNKKGIIK
tara:strand:+ start:18782 stop:19138 length:357 start_codon:yes stop_codon:yes gene_type:complete